MLDLLAQSPVLFVSVAIALILSISIHEFSHAYVADKLGDPTARYLGRITLNPASHLDPIGFMMLIFAGFGWGRPVPFNPVNLKNIKRDSALIALAGPASNIILAVILSVVIKFIPLNAFFSMFMYLLILYNLILGFFNLIPLHPLDGFKIVYGLLPQSLSFQWLQMESYGLIILLFLVMTNATSVFITPLVNIALRILGVK